MIQQNAEALLLEKKNNAIFSIMTEADNREVLDLVNSTAIKGNIEISFTKGPDYLKVLKICADDVQAVIGKVNNKVEILGTRSLKKAYINGAKETLGYLSDLKISKNAKKIHALSDGFKFMKSLMDDNRAKLHIATIIEDNKQGKIALTWANKNPNIPNFYDLGIMNTYFILPLLPKFISKKVQIIRGTIDILDDIVEFLNTEGRKKQFFPIYTKEDFLNLPNFNVNDFYVAIKNNVIIGVIAKWEQTPFKQVIIKKYNNKWKWIKKFTGKILPQENEQIKQFYLGFMAIKDNDNSIFEALLGKIHNDNRHYKYFSLILHSQDNLNRSLNKFLSIKYKSRLYITEFIKNEEIIKMIDDRIPYLELAGL